MSAVIAVGAWLAIPAGILAIASLVVRFRGAGRDDRERIKWLAYVAVTGASFLFVGEIVSWAAGCEVKCGDAVFAVFFAAMSIGIPAAVGGAILRHGLYDIDIVIRKTVVVAVFATFFVAIYALVVGGVGALISTSSNAALSFAAAAIVAILFQPVLTRARKFADLVVYGKRATPYEVLAEFSGRMAGHANDVVLAEMARVVGEGTGATRSEVWLRLGGNLHPAGAWPADRSAQLQDRPLEGDDPPPLEADVSIPVRYRDELLGALAVTMPPAEPATEATRKLVADLAGQAGFVLRNVRLLEELRASRKRLVTAQDAERRRLERDIHDGAQQQLVALKLRLRLAEATAEKDPRATKQALAELSDATQAALDDLRDLARGIYPPLLADQGLTVALEAQAKKSPVDVLVSSEITGRYPQEAEAAVYFCALEALQNIAKYAEASSATVRLWTEDGMLSFSVTDTGRGFDTSQTGYGTGLQGMADRLAALGGSLEVRSERGAGTTVAGRIPA